MRLPSRAYAVCVGIGEVAHQGMGEDVYKHGFLISVVKARQKRLYKHLYFMFVD